MLKMKKGDLAFFYHSNCKVPGIAGVMEIARESSVDGMCRTISRPSRIVGRPGVDQTVH